jgi:RHS repeat-associated protein
VQPLLKKLPDAKQARAKSKRSSSLMAAIRKGSVSDTPAPAPGPLAATGHDRKLTVPANPDQHRRAFAEPLPSIPTAKPPRKIVQLAHVAPRERGVAIDYSILVTQNTPFTLRGDTTYWVQSGVFLNAQVTLEGGAVIKSDPYFPFGGTPDYNLAVWVNATTLVCNTTPYRPAVFTAWNDDTIGEKITSTKISSDGFYSYRAIGINAPTASTDLHDVRIVAAVHGYTLWNNGPQALFRNSQVVNCSVGYAPYQATGIIRNVLISGSTYAPIVSGSTTLTAENMTADGGFQLFGNTLPGSTFTFNNCLTTAITQLGNGTYTGTGNSGLIPSAGVYQTVGAGAHYLSANSPHRNVGTTAIDPTLLSELKTKTTFPPTVVTANVTSDTVWSPTVQRDTDAPDLGFHYNPIDYAVSGKLISNATLTVTNGAVVAAYGDFGLTPTNGAVVVSVGKPDNMNRFVRYQQVQEEANTSWAGNSTAVWRIFKEKFTTGGTKPQASFRFTDMPLLANGGARFTGGDVLSKLTFQDSQLYGGSMFFNTAITSSTTVALTNSLFERVTLYLGNTTDTVISYARNNLFRNSALNLSPSTVNSWEWRDNLFDGVSLTRNNNSVLNSHNGYQSTATHLTPVTSGDVTLTSLAYVSGPFSGNYYQPANSPLINVGSRLATSAGLAHYTTQNTAFNKDTLNVDIGLHYVAFDGSVPALPVDSDLDGLPDYLADWNGNGITDPGESSWSNPAITLGSSPITYAEGSAAVLIDSSATASDVDSPSGPLFGGQMVVDLSANANSFDQLALLSQSPIIVDSVNFTISFNSVLVAGYTGGTALRPLVVTLNTAATYPAVQEIVRHLTFKNISDNPGNLARTVRIVLNTGDGARSFPATRTVNVTVVDDVPVLSFSAGISQYVPGSASVVVDPLSSVADFDTGSFNGYTLKIDYAAGGNGDVNDLLDIRHNGYAAEQIGVRSSGGTRFAMFGGVDIGTMTGGQGAATPLQIVLNSSATSRAVRALLRSLTFRSTSSSPPLNARIIRAQLTNPSGGDSTAKTKQLQVGCFTALDVMLIIDRSGSMADKASASPPRFPITNAKVAAKSLVNRLASGDKAGLVSFANIASLDQGLTLTKPSVNTKIDALSALGSTYMAQAIVLAQSELSGPNHQTGALPLIILLTDGRPNDGTEQVLTAAETAKLSGTRIITIGLGLLETDGQLLQQVASPNSSRPSGRDWYVSPSPNELQSVYDSIAGSICRAFSGNVRPTIAIGAEQRVFINQPFDLGLAANGPKAMDPDSQYTLTWSEVSGPGSIMFDPPTLVKGATGTLSAVSTKITVKNDAEVSSQPGLYVLRLTAADQQYSVSADLNLYVFPDTDPDPPPIVNAGPPQTISVGATITMQGVAVNQGAGSVTTEWSVDPADHALPPTSLGGNPTVSFGNAAITNTTANGFTVPGFYQLKLTATKAGDSVSDTVAITACDQGENPADVMLAIDRSSSVGFNGLLPSIRAAAKIFVDRMNLSVHQVSVESFHTESTLDQQLTHDRQAIVASIDALQDSLSLATRFRPPIEQARAELFGRRRNPAALPVLVYLTDGAPSDPEEVQDLTVAARDAKLEGITIITIGFGVAAGSTEESILKNVLSSSDQDYYRVADTAALKRAYESIAGTFCFGRTPRVVSYAGPDRMTTSTQVTLSGRVWPTNSIVDWSVQSGSATIGNLSSLTPTVTFSQMTPGTTATLRLRATSGFQTATSDIVISYGKNTLPIARPDFYTASYNSQQDRQSGQILDVLANDIDPDGDPLRIVAIRPVDPYAGTFNPATVTYDGGAITVTIVGGKQLRLIPKLYSSAFPGGVEKFEYLIWDGKEATLGTAIVTVVLLPNNSPPRARDDYFFFLLGGPSIPLSVLANDENTDPSVTSGSWLWSDHIEIVSVTPLSPGGKGTLQAVSDPSKGILLNYIPQIGGITPYTETFQYTIQDRSGAKSTATVILKSKGTGQNLMPQIGGISVSDGPYSLDQWVTMSGFNISDDGLPSPPSALTFAWSVSMVPPGSPPNPVLFSSPDDDSTSAVFDPAALPGTYQFQLSVSDSSLANTSPIVSIVVAAANRPPTAGILNVNDSDVITMGSLPVTGLADDPDNTVSYTLAILPIDQGSNPPPLVSVAFNGNVPDTGTPPFNPLGTLDLTKLRNGVYDLRLSVTGGTATITDTRRITLNTPVQLGRFTFSEQDIVIPVNGIPITVIRTYDSFNQTTGSDFGLSWTFAIKDMDVQFDEIRQQVSDSSLLSPDFPPTGFVPFSFRVGGGRNVALTMPDGRRAVFTYSVRLGPLGVHYAEWSPPQGVFASLVPLNANRALLDNRIVGLFSLTPFWFVSGGPSPDFFTPMENYDVPGFLLTTSDGTQYEIMRQEEGSQGEIVLGGAYNGISVTPYNKAKLTRIYRPNGEYLEFSDTSVDRWSPGAPPSKTHSIEFVRDAATGRILEIRDLNRQSKNDPPLVKYTYTGSQLTQVDKLVDKSSPPVWQSTVYHYIQVNGLTYLDTIKPTPTSPPIMTAQYHTTTSGFDPGRVGRLQSVANGLGQATTFDYNTSARQQFVTDPLGHMTTYAYDDRGNITKTTFPLNGVDFSMDRTFDQDNNVVSAFDPNPVIADPTLFGTTVYTHDLQGDVIEFVRFDPFTFQESHFFTYNKFGQVITSTHLDVIISNDYDTKGNLTRTTDAVGNVTDYFYDASSHLTKITDARLNDTTYQYDARDNLARVTDSDGLFTEFTYDDGGRRVGSKDRAGRTTAYTYDELNRLRKTTYADGSSASTTYDLIGRIQSTTDTRGYSTSFLYDAAGQRTRTTNPLGQFTQFQYDLNGNTTKIIDPLLHETNFTYDELNRRTKIIFGAGSPPNRITEYDALGRKTAEIDEAAVRTEYLYDVLDHLLQVKNAAGTADEIVTQYGYDGAGHLISSTNANNTILTSGQSKADFVVDRGGRLLGRRLFSNGNFETFAYDAVGNLSVHIDFFGRATTFTYNSLNRLIAKNDLTLPVGSQTVVSYTYAATSQRASMSDASGTTSYNYDMRDRLIGKATPSGSLSYTYDADGHVLSIASSSPGGATTSYQWDELGRIKQASDDGGTTVYNYDAAGNLQDFTYPSSVKTTFGYDSRNRLTSVAATKTPTTLGSFTYTLGVAGNRTSGAETINTVGIRSVNYTYDPLYRLKQESIVAGGFAPTGTVTYDGTAGYTDTTGHDRVGNRRQRSVSLTPPVTGFGTLNHTYDVADRLTTPADTYDANGNTTASPGLAGTFGYDLDNRLISRSTGPAVQIVYDGDGNRVRKTVAGVTTHYLVDDRNPTGYAQVLEELSSPGTTPLRIYTYGHDLLRQKVTGTAKYFGYDGLGSVRFLSDTGGNVTDTYTYDAFGTLIQSTGSATATRYLYTGEQYDSDLGLYYLRARYYSPNTGRFWTMDPFEGDNEDPTTLHAYLYGGGNPINRTDPSGAFFDTGSLLTSARINQGLEVANALATQAAKVLAKRTLAQSIARITIPALVAAGYLGAATEAGEEQNSFLIYRGIPRTREPDYSLALQGIARPRGTRLDLFALELHVQNQTVASGVTSWTTTRGVARRFSGSDGVILEVQLFTVIDRIVARPPVSKYNYEHEILLKGVIRATPTSP